MRYSPKQLEALKAVAEGRIVPSLVREEDGWHARWRGLGGGGDQFWIDEFVRSAAMTPLTEDAELDRHETLHDAWIAALRSRSGLVAWDDAECTAFAAELGEWSGGAEVDAESRRGIVFELMAEDGRFEVACRARRSRRMLRALGQAVAVWPALCALAARGNGGELVLSLSRGEAEEFARSAARELEAAGYRVAGLPPRAAVTAEADVEAAGPRPEDGATAKGARARVALTVRVDGEVVGADEIRFLLDQGSTLVYFRDRWIEVDRAVLRAALRALEKGAPAKGGALAFALGVGHFGGLEVETLRAHGWLRGFVNELRGAGGAGLPGASGVDAPGLRGELRGYQRRGVAWMKFLTDNGFGALLADDMGLGKTVQAIAWMLATAPAKAAGPVLVVAPLTLLANWRRELKAFAPSLRVYVHQGETRHVASGFLHAAAESDVVLTSYTLLVRDHAEFAEVPWRAAIADEAQSVKNPDTRAARALKALSPPSRIALTGTPVENSLLDLWALEDFLNPGFLGDRPDFRGRFVRVGEEGAQSRATARLRRALEPFVLRRLKTDPEVAAELGEKREVREYCALSPDDRRAYERALADYRGAERSPGDAFALLTELKLVCDGEGKFERLCELLEAIFAAGESALVFTQYAKVGARLRSALAERFGRRFPFLHGGLTAAEREEEVKAFGRPDSLRSDPQAFILSLRAGGFGLNLVKATHVVHYDRWWNPAVESQATDRAHRIGQRRDVLVHLMISEGTVEEHVDELLRQKVRLQDALKDGEEFWRTVSLDADAEGGGA